MPTSVFALADPHLSNVSADRYGMSSYGGAWAQHPENLFAAWKATVSDDSVVLVPGDITLEVKPAAASDDLARIDALPGFVKALSKGNHDLGFGKTLGKWRTQCEPFPTLLPFLGSAAQVDTPDGPLIIAATKGAYVPGDMLFDGRYDADSGTTDRDAQRAAQNEKIYQRELRRLQAALTAAAQLSAHADDAPIVCMIHYPPFINMHKPSAFSQMIQDAGVQLCVYGHIHGEDWHRQAFQGIRAGTTYRLVAADFLNMTPALVATLNDGHLTVHQPSSA